MRKINYKIDMKIFFTKFIFIINVIKLIIDSIFFFQFKMIIIFFAKNDVNDNNIN